MPERMERNRRMSQYFKTAMLFLLVLGLWCAQAWPGNVLTQISTIDALLAGAYDGQVTIGELKAFGDLGIGTFNALDGEMIALNGRVFQARADGQIVAVPDSLTTPFAVMVFFEAEKTLPLPSGINLEALTLMTDPLLPSVNLFYAFRIEGTFDTMRVRSVPGQTKPYPPLTEVVQHQYLKTLEKVEGVVVGFRCPPFVRGVNVPGYHLHFIDKDEKAGGHVLEFTVAKAVLQWDEISNFHMMLPRDPLFSRMNLEKDRQEDLQKVEK